MNLREYLVLNNFSNDELDNIDKDKIKDALKEAKIYKYYERVKNIALALSFVLGLLSAATILSYSGKEPVNISYFLFFAFLMPVVFAFFTIIAIFSKHYFSPFNLIQKLINFFKKDKIELKINSNLEKFLSLKNSILMQLSFAIGFIISFIFLLLIKDIAFAWSSTIVNLDEFKALVNFISSPWYRLLPNFVPSQSVIEHSQFFRLNSLSGFNAKELSSWWGFLYATAVFYMIILRVILLLIVEFFYKKAFKEAFENSLTISLIKNKLNSSKIEIKSNNEKNYIDKVDKKVNLNSSNCNFENILGWNYQKEELEGLLNSIGLKPKAMAIVGGLNSFAKDLETIKNFASKELVLIVKSWDVPTLDFIDFLEELSKRAKSVGIYFDKKDEKGYKIWIDKIEAFEFKNIKVCKWV